MLNYTRGRTAFPQPSLCSSYCQFPLALSQGWLSKPLGRIPDSPIWYLPFAVAPGSAAGQEWREHSWSLGWLWERLQCCWAAVGESPTCFLWLLPGFTSSNAWVSRLNLRKITSEGVPSSQLPVGGITPWWWHFVLCFELYQVSSPSSQNRSFIKAGDPSWCEGRSEMVWGISQTCTSSSLGPNPSSAPNRSSVCPSLVWVCPGLRAGVLADMQGKKQFSLLCFQEGEEIWTDFGEANPLLEKVLGATILWRFSGVSLRYHLSRRFAVPGNFRDVCFFPGLTEILVSHLEISSYDYSRIWKTFCSY